MNKATEKWNTKRYQESISALRTHLEHRRLLSLAMREYLDRKPTPIWKSAEHSISLLQVRTYQTLFRGLETSATTLIGLTERVGEHVRDCFPIARCIVEGSINLAYIAAGGITVAEQARKHSLQRAILDLDRQLEIGTLRFRHRSRCLDVPDTVPGLRSALAECEEQNDRKRRDWTELSTPKRIAVVLDRLGTRTGSLLANAYFSIYQDASEIVHGTVYGSFLSRGETSRDQEVALHDKTFCVLFASATALNRAVAAIGQAHSIEAVWERADSFDLLLLKVPLFAQAIAESDEVDPTGGPQVT